jgi:hypothetical protein
MSDPMAAINHHRSLGCVMSMAERELGAFMTAVTELWGPEEARIAADHWLDELESMDRIPGLTSREWRLITIRAAARVASRLTQLGHRQCASGRGNEERLLGCGISCGSG